MVDSQSVRVQPEAEKNLFDLPSFRSWLQARSSQVVGRSAHEYGCPLAHFLSEGCHAFYGVGDGRYWVVGDIGRTLLPSWASAFVRCLDFTHPLDEVTGAQALHLLDTLVVSASPVWKVCTFGYAVKEADERLVALMADPSMMLIDIRLSPYSRFHPAFRGSALEQRFGVRYVHIPALGNLNYRHRTLPIVLAHPSEGLSSLEFWVECGFSVCLLCACAHVESCHRRTVADLLIEHYSCEIVHL